MTGCLQFLFIPAVWAQIARWPSCIWSASGHVSLEAKNRGHAPPGVTTKSKCTKFLRSERGDSLALPALPVSVAHVAAEGNVVIHLLQQCGEIYSLALPILPDTRVAEGAREGLIMGNRASGHGHFQSPPRSTGSQHTVNQVTNCVHNATQM